MKIIPLIWTDYLDGSSFAASIDGNFAIGSYKGKVELHYDQYAGDPIVWDNFISISDAKQKVQELHDRDVDFAYKTIKLFIEE